MLSLPLVVGAFVAGVAMFLAPCTLPIVPGYLAFIAGQGANRGRVVRNALWFVLGFSAVFVLLGVFAAGVGHILGPWRVYVPQVSGAVIVLFGLTMLGVQVPGLSLERHIRLPHFLQIGRASSSFVLGALFALGWSPCIGPLLGTILLVASTTTTAAQGAFLLAIFSLGLAVPFIICALVLNAAGSVVARLGKVTALFNTAGAVLLITLGLLMLFNKSGLLLELGQMLLGPMYGALLQYM